MLCWVRQFKDASPQTKYFVLTWFIYGITLIITTIYCYGRLDYVRSYRTDKAKLNEQSLQTHLKNKSQLS